MEPIATCHGAHSFWLLSAREYSTHHVLAVHLILLTDFSTASPLPLMRLETPTTSISMVRAWTQLTPSGVVESERGRIAGIHFVYEGGVKEHKNDIHRQTV